MRRKEKAEERGKIRKRIKRKKLKRGRNGRVGKGINKK